MDERSHHFRVVLCQPRGIRFSFATAGSGSWRGLPKGTNRWILAGACLAGPSGPEVSVDVIFTETVGCVIELRFPVV